MEHEYKHLAADVVKLALQDAGYTKKYRRGRRPNPELSRAAFQWLRSKKAILWFEAAGFDRDYILERLES